MNEEGEPIVKEKEEDILDTFKNYVYVPEVVRKDGMQFQKVPRLGSFLAVPIVYQSCLFDEALEAAAADYVDVETRKEQQVREKNAHEEEQN